MGLTDLFARASGKREAFFFVFFDFSHRQFLRYHGHYMVEI